MFPHPILSPAITMIAADDNGVIEMQIQKTTNLPINKLKTGGLPDPTFRSPIYDLIGLTGIILW